MRNRFDDHILRMLTVGVAVIVPACTTGDEAGHDNLANHARVQPTSLTFDATFIRDAVLTNPDGRQGHVLSLIDDYEQSDDPTRAVYLFANRADGSSASDTQIVAEETSNPFGFLRRATGYREEGSDIVIETEPASLEQVMADVDVSGAIDMSEGHVPAGAAFARPDTQPGPRIPRIDLSGRELWRDGSSYLRLGETFVQMDSVIDYALVAKLFRLRDARLIINMVVDTQLTIDAHFEHDVPRQMIEREIYSTAFQLPVIANFVPVTVRLALRVGCEFGGHGTLDASAGLRATTPGRLGFTYNRDTGLMGVGAGELATSVIGPTFAVAGNYDVGCYLEPRFAVMFFDVVGPHAKVRATGKLDFTAPPEVVAIGATVEGTVGGSARLFSFEFGELELPPLIELVRAVFNGPSK